MPWVFSHWEQRVRPHWYGNEYYYVPIDMWVEPIRIVITIRRPSRPEVDPFQQQLKRYEEETILALALRDKIEAETAAVKSLTNLAIQRAKAFDLMPLLDPPDAARLMLAHDPAIPMRRIN